MGHRVNRITGERDALGAELSRVIDGQPWRFHKYAPAQPVAPAIWIGSPEVSTRSIGITGSLGTIITFPVTAVVNGDDSKQMQMLDELVSRIWDAAYANRSQPVDSRPTVIDVGGAAAAPRGGAQLRGQIVRIERIVITQTLCTQTMEN